MKRIMAIIITLVLIVVGAINGLAYAKSTQEPMIGHKLVGWGDLGSLLDLVQANFSVSFTNPDSASEISIDQVSIIRGDGEVIFEGKLSEYAKAIASAAWREGVVVKTMEDGGRGIRVRLLDDDLEIDLTDEAIAELLLKHLQPRFRAVLTGMIGQ